MPGAAVRPQAEPSGSLPLPVGSLLKHTHVRPILPPIVRNAPPTIDRPAQTAERRWFSHLPVPNPPSPVGVPTGE